MPGFVLHLVAAKMLLDRLDSKIQLNEFMVGNLLPDVSSDKARTHFHSPNQCNQIIRYPELDVFTNKYKLLLNNNLVLGYLYHLYVDRKFYKEFLPRIITFLDAYGELELERQRIEWVLIKRTGRKIPIKAFYSDEYYYGDFTRMNSFLVEHYQINLDFDLNIKNPGIEEIDIQDIKRLLEQMKEYISLSPKNANDLQVFDVQDILLFLEEVAQEFLLKR